MAVVGMNYEKGSLQRKLLVPSLASFVCLASSVICNSFSASSKLQAQLLYHPLDISTCKITFKMPSTSQIISIIVPIKVYSATYLHSDLMSPNTSHRTSSTPIPPSPPRRPCSSSCKSHLSQRMAIQTFNCLSPKPMR